LTSTLPTMRPPGQRARHLGRHGHERLARLRILDPRLWVPVPPGPRLPGGRDWDEFYGSSVDPYGIETSGLEQSRYEQTLRALGDRRFSRALEVGCGEGVLSELLVPRCAQLLALDVSAVAVDRAGRRMAGRRGVTVERRTLPEEMPGGPFDLILCRDVLYYWDRERLLAGLHAFEQALMPGGWLLVVHERHDTNTHAMSGERVHRLLVRNTTLRHVWRRTEWVYRFDRFERPA
jgi:SAM-dependent methyltransferase